MSAPDSALGLAFTPSATPLDYGRRIGRLRWRRSLGLAGAAEPSGDMTAAGLARPELCVLVRDERALLARMSGPPRVEPGAVVPCMPLAVGEAPAVHTLRELEEAGLPVGQGSWEAARVPAVAFRPAEVPASPGETVSAYAARLFAAATGPADPSFRALVFDDPSEHERPELVARLAEGTGRLCDVGCASGAAAAAWKRASGGRATGIESDPRAAAVARTRLDRVLQADAPAALEQLCREGETFDAFLLADVLEHLPDPVAALALARRLAATPARLVASVPNVSHLSIVRDLVLGRFDPMPAGLLDAGHVRWFTRSLLAEVLEEGGWTVTSIEGIPGAPAPDADAFLRRLAEWPGCDRKSLSTYQWIAVARADASKEGMKA